MGEICGTLFNNLSDILLKFLLILMMMILMTSVLSLTDKRRIVPVLRRLRAIHTFHKKLFNSKNMGEDLSVSSGSRLLLRTLSITGRGEKGE